MRFLHVAKVFITYLLLVTLYVAVCGVIVLTVGFAFCWLIYFATEHQWIWIPVMLIAAAAFLTAEELEGE